MTFDITIQHDLKELQKSLSTLERKVAPQATVRTLNRIAESAKVASVKHIAPQIGSRQAGVKRRIKTNKATKKKLWATLTAHGRALQLIEFVVGSKKPTQQTGGKRGLVRTKVMGKSKTYKVAFIAPRRAGDSKTTMYMRKGKARKPVRMMFGPGIEQLFKTTKNDKIMQETIRKRFAAEFARNLAFYVKRLKNRK